MLRYIFRRDAPRNRRIYHDRDFLTESCNTDQLGARRAEAAVPPERYRLCDHCRTQQGREGG